MSALGKSVRLFLADGTPGGLVTAETMNWTGHVIAAPRSDLGTLLKRPETSRTGVYVLLGDDPDASGGTLAYVGEGDDVGKRIAAHHREEGSGGKDFWDRVLDANDWFIDSGEYYFWDVLAALGVVDRDRYCVGEQMALAALYEEAVQHH